MNLRQLGRRLARLRARNQDAADLHEEMRLHLELRARRLREQGIPEEEAKYAALRQFGNRGALADASAAVWGWPACERLLQDLRHALRSLRKTPGFTLVTVATLAAGLGMNTAVFSVVNAVILRRLPYADPGRLVSLWEEEIKPDQQNFNSSGTQAGRAGTSLRTTVSVANLADYTQPRIFASLASYDRAPMNLTGTGAPERISGEAVSAGFFETLGIEAALGRTFTSEDDQPGAPPVVVLAADFWQHRLGGDAAVLGRDVVLDGTPRRVIGVLPRAFRSPLQIAYAVDAAEFYVPAAYPNSLLTARGDHEVNVVARLLPGISIAAAQAALDTVSSRLQKQFPRSNGNFRAALAPLADDLVHRVTGPLWILLAASGLIVLITCVNIANLMLVRAVRRGHESSVRMALGAGRAGLVRQYLAESLAIAAAGCVAALALGAALRKLLVALAPPGTPRLDEVGMDWRVFAVAAALAASTGLLFGIVPAWQASRAHAAEALKTAARSTATKSQSRWRAALTTAEIALSLVLLVGAGLLLRSFRIAMGVDLGFQTERVLAMNINLPDLRYATAEARFEFFRQLEQRVEALPGVEAAAFANRMPMRGGWSTSVALDSAPDREVMSAAQAVSIAYFETLGIPLLRGRYFTLQDRGGAPPVAIVNREFARRYLQDADPVGRRLLRGKTWCRIIGVVNDIRRGGKLDTLNPQIYFPAAQTAIYPVRLADLAVRAAADPRRLVNAIQQQVWALDRDQPVTNVRSMQEIISQSVAQNRFDMLLLLVFAAVAVMLATIGIFGVLSYLVSQRTSELGIRVALGASPRRLLALVLCQAGTWIAAGVTLGIAGTLAATRSLEALLFQVKRTDPLTYAAAIALLVTVSLTAALIPAARGSRTDPIHALRNE